VAGACSSNVGKEKCVKELLEIGWGGMDWIGLAHDRDKCRALMNAVMNLRVP
jgi:hypothetical protein